MPLSQPVICFSCQMYLWLWPLKVKVNNGIGDICVSLYVELKALSKIILLLFFQKPLHLISLFLILFNMLK